MFFFLILPLSFLLNSTMPKEAGCNAVVSGKRKKLLFIL